MCFGSHKLSMLKIDRNTRSNVTRVTGSVVKKAMLARKKNFKLPEASVLAKVNCQFDDISHLFLNSRPWSHFSLEFVDHRKGVNILLPQTCLIHLWRLQNTVLTTKKAEKENIWRRFVRIFGKDLLLGTDISFSGKFVVFTDQYTMLYSPVRQRLFKNRTLVPEWRLFPEIYLKIALFI